MTSTNQDASEARRRVRAKWDEIEDADPWGVLGVARSASADEIKRAYFALAREFHADAWSDVPLGDDRAVLDRVFARIAEAYETLSEPSKRAELEAELALKASGTSTDIGALLDAEQDFSKGRLLLERGEITAAGRFFAKAIAVNPSNVEWKAHHLFTSWWPARVAKDAPARIDALEAMANTDDRLLDALYFAGRLALEIDDTDRATRHLKHVVRQKPGHEMATRDLRLLTRRLEQKPKRSKGFFARLLGR